MNYTDAQLEAIRHRDGNLLIIACAGSGKTEVISLRIAQLVSEGTPRDSIIAFTFTERAARELKARIRRHLELLRPDDPSLGDMYVGTIHSFCLRLLKEIDPQYRGFEVMDEAMQAALIASNYASGIGLDRLRPRTRTRKYWDALKSFVNTLNVVHQRRIRPETISDPTARDAVVRYKEIAMGRPNQFFDFNEIVEALLDRFGSDPAALESVRSRFQYLIVDEYQDVDPRQEELIRLLSADGTRIQVTAVGDDDQSVYGWRGADIGNILTFETRYPNVTKVELVDNFRSTHGIVDIANAAIRRIPVGRRLGKSMIARKWETGPAGPVLAERMAEQGDIHRQTNFATEDDEARWVAGRVEQLLGTVIEEKDGTERAIHYADMAVLLRSVKSSGQVVVDALRTRNIPVVVKGTKGLFGQDEILLGQAVFCLLASADFSFTDAENFCRFGEAATREFVRAAVDRLRARDAMPYADAAVLLEWVAEKRRKLEQQNLSRERRGRLSRRIYPQSIFHEMLNKLGAGAGPDPWPADILYNLGRLSRLITQFEAVHQWLTPRDLTSLCLFLGGWASSNTDEGGADEVAVPNAVQVMTVHAAKGLEWPVVFLPSVSSRIFPSSLRTRGPETFLSAAEFNPRDYAGGNEGERRLWYVGLTRCRKFLHVSSVHRHNKKPTDYITEIRHDYVRDDGVDPTPRGMGVPTQPADAELLPTTYSDLNYFWQCPFDYQLRALMGFGPGVKESYGYGQQLHNILAEIHNMALVGAEITEAVAEDLVERRFNLRYTAAGPLEILRGAAKKTLARYLKEYADHLDLVLKAEKPFEYLDRDTGALITGTIDLLERVETTPEGRRVEIPVALVEFKTQKWRELAEFLERKGEAEIQLGIYASASRRSLGLDPRTAAAHFLSPAGPSDELRRQGVTERVEMDVSDAQQERIRTMIKNAVLDIKRGMGTNDFARSGCGRGRCPKCDFRLICPGYGVHAHSGGAAVPPRTLEEEWEEEIDKIEEDASE